MPTAISSQMASSLVALTMTNDEISSTQGRLASGLAIASASDNIAVYFKAKSFNDRADAYDTVNKNISQAVANIDTVDKALTNMQDTLKGALQLMKDARAKAMPQSLAASVAGDTVYGSRTAAAGPPPVLALQGKIVSSNSQLTAGAAPGDVNDGTIFQQGDVFAITIRDTANPSSNATMTRYFRATSTEAAVSANAQQINNAGQFVNVVAGGNPVAADGSTQQKAMNFNDMASLKAAIQNAFGNTAITVSMNEQGAAGSGNWKMGFAMQSASQSISFMQTNDQPQGNGPGAALDPGTSFNFAALFGKQQGFVVNAQGQQQFDANGLPLKANNTNVQQGLATLNGVTGNAYTYSPVGPPQSAIDAVQQTRREAASFFNQTLYGLKNTMGDAFLPGFGNILAGEAVTIPMNDIGSVTQTVKLGKAVDPLSLGFAGYDDTNGPKTTASANDFVTDASLDTAIGQVNTAVASLKQNQTYLAAAKVQINARLDYNKSLVTTLTTTANKMTAADTTSDAAGLAALQNRQTFATNNMAMTKQAEQSLIQLLR
jgi:flagellin